MILSKQRLMLTTNSMAASKKRQNPWIWVCFFVYLVALFYMLFFAEAFGRTGHVEEYRYNVTLFREITRFYRYGKSHSWDLFLFNVVGNIVVFIPFGMFLPHLFKRCRNLIFTMLLSLEFSLVIEMIQLLSRVGRFDVDDLLLNTIGGSVGCILFFIGSWMRKGQSARKGRK